MAKKQSNTRIPKGKRRACVVLNNETWARIYELAQWNNRGLSAQVQQMLDGYLCNHAAALNLEEVPDQPR